MQSVVTERVSCLSRPAGPLTAGVLFMVLVASAGAPAADQPATQADQAQAEFVGQLRALHWVTGPEKVTLFDKSALQLPEGYRFLNTEETSKLQALTHNLSGGKQYFFAPGDLHWSAYIRYQDDGYVKDDQKIDADAILKNIKENTDAANSERRQRGWDEMQVLGWQTPPHYDTDTKQLEWAVNGRDLKTNEVTVNFNTRILGRGGVTSVVLLSSPENLDVSIGEFKKALAQFAYLPGQSYAEYKPGDKLAKYGLAALITGGAAAIAVKTGFWKVLLSGLIAGWKFIAAGAVALFGGLTRLFKRKNT